MPITGNDELSIRILNELDAGMHLKEILLRHPISLDQAKRISRYRRMLQAVKEHLSENELNKVKQFGLKVLVLAPLFKKEDWSGLQEVLDSTNERTTRTELTLLLQALEEKRKQIAEANTKIGLKLTELEKQEADLNTLRQELQQKQAMLDEKVKFLNLYPPETRHFLLNHLGLFKQELVLARRLDSNWQKDLKKRNILRYDDLNYVWHVVDLEQLAAAYIKRIGGRAASAIEWDYEKELARNREARYPVPSSPFYQFPNGLAENLRSSINAIQEKVHRIETEREVILKEINRLRKASPTSFLESVEAANEVSERDLKAHGELQDMAMKWLYRQGFVVSSEVRLPNGRRCDVIGYSETGHIVIIEVKVSKADFLHDKKWTSYLTFCHEFYFLTSPEVLPLYYSTPDYIGIGLLEKNKSGLCIHKPFNRKQMVVEAKKVHFAISRSLSKKWLLGI